MSEIIEKARSAALKSCSKIILACEILKMKDKKGKENRILVVSENLLFLYKESKSSLSEDSKFYLTELTEYKIDDEFIEMKFGKSGLKFKSENDDVPIATINEKILRALSSIKSEDELSKLNVKFPNDQFSPKPELSSILARFDYNLKKNKKIIHADSTYKYLKTCFVSTLKQLNFNEKNVHNDKVDSLFEQLFDSLKLYNSMESIIFEKLDKKAEIFPILSQYISQMKQLKHIFINSSQTKKFKEFCESAKKSNLVAITLSGFEMKKEFISQLKNLAQEKNFTSINFIGNIKSDNLVSDFMKSQNSIKLLGLQKLDCMKKMDKLFPLFTNLNSLSLRGCNLSIQSIFESLSKNSSTLLHLRYLDISQNIPDFFRTPDHIPPQLMRLDICEMTWDNIKLSRLLHFIFHRNWHAGLMLNMEKTKLESGTFDESLMLIKNYPLVSLIWDENELSDEFFEFLSHNKNLKYLSFNKCFGPDFDPTIEEEFTTYVPKLKNLQRLSLIGDGTADNSNVIIAFIRSLKENKTLEYLDISNNKLGDKGLTVLKEMIFSCKSLKTVIFDNSEVETSDCFNSFVDSLDLRKPIMAYYPFETIKALVSQKILAKEDAVQLKKRFYGIQGNEFDEINDYVEDIPVKIVSEFSHQFPLYIDDELREIFEIELPENEPEIPVIVEEETEFSETSFVPINNNNADNPNTSPHLQNENENVNKDEDHDDVMSGVEEEKREEKDQEINNDDEKEKSVHEIVSQKNKFDESSSTSSHHNKIIKQKEENKKETGNNLSKVKKSLFDDSSSEEIKGNPKADNTSLHEEEEEIPEFSKSKQEIKNDDELIQSKENKKSRFDNSSDSDSSARPPASKKKKFGFDSSSEELVSPKKKKRPQFSDEDEKENNKSPQNKKKPIFSDSSDEKPNHANKHFSDEEEQDEWPSSSDETNSKQKSKKNDQINSIKKRKSFFSSDDDKLEKPHPQKSSNKQKDILKFSSSESESDPKAKAKSKQNQKHDSDSLKKGKENQKIKKSNNFDDSSESLDSEKLLASSKDKPKLKQKPNSRFDEDDDNSYEEKIMKNKQNPKLVKKNSDDGLENIPKKKISSPNRNNKNIFKNKRIYSGDDDDEIRQDEHVLEITEKIKSKARKLKKSKQNKNSSSSDEKLDSQKKKVSLEKQTSSSESDEKAEYTNSNQKSKNKTSLKRISDMKSSSHKRKKGVFFDDDDDDEIENKNEMKSDKNTKLQNSNNVFLKGDKGSKSRFSDSSDFEEEENIKEQKRVKTNIFSSDEDVFDSKKKKSNSLHKKTSFSKRKDFSGSSDENMSDSNDNIQKFKKKSDKNQQNSKFEKMKVNENKFTSDSEINDLPVKSTNSKKQDFLRKESKEENKRSNAKHKANSRSNDNKSENSSDSESDKIHKKISNKVNSKKIKSSSESENESESDKNIKKSTSNKSKNNIANDTNNLLNAPKRKPANIDEDDDEPPRRRRRRSIPKVEIINEKTTINKTRNPKSYQPTHPNNTTDSDSDSESSSDSENNKDNSFHNKGIKKSRSQNSYPNSNHTNLNNKNRIEKQNPNKNQFNTQQKNQIKKKGQEDQKRRRSRNNEAKIVEIEYHPPSWEDFPLPRIFKGHDTPILRDLEEEFTISSVIHALKHENDNTK